MAGASLGLSGGVSGSGSSVDGGASFGGVVMESVVCVLLFCALSEGVSYESLFDESSVGVVWESLFCVSNVGVMLESLSLASPGGSVSVPMFEVSVEVSVLVSFLLLGTFSVRIMVDFRYFSSVSPTVRRVNVYSVSAFNPVKETVSFCASYCFFSAHFQEAFCLSSVTFLAYS